MVLKVTARCAFLAICATMSACSSVGNALNPFYEAPQPVALLGEMNDNALNSGGGSEDKARLAFNEMAKYRAALPAEPTYPVMQPAVVRLMWVPDHLNKSGDLVPAHFYYLKVLRDRWAVQDAFELEAQLSGDGRPTGGGGNLPFVLDNEKR
mgnify:CR=1 FL=1